MHGYMSTTTTTLNHLIEVLKDGQQGFAEAARDIVSADLKAVLSGYAMQREQFATELQVLAQDLGDEHPKESGSVSGAIHRGWINIKASITSRDEHSILEECERGEDAAMAAYQNALENDAEGMPAAAANAVRRQYEDIVAAHNRVRYLRDALAPFQEK